MRNNIDRRALLRRAGTLATAAAAISTLPALASTARDPLEDISAALDASIERSCAVANAIDEAEEAAREAGFQIDRAPMTVGYNACISAECVERSAAEAGFSPERTRELVGVWQDRERERQAQRKAAGLIPLDEAEITEREEWERLARLLIDTPAVAVAGIAVKLRRIAAMADDGWSEQIADLARSALRDTEQLAGSFVSA